MTQGKSNYWELTSTKFKFLVLVLAAIGASSCTKKELSEQVGADLSNSGLLGVYYDSTGDELFAEKRFVRVDQGIDFNWSGVGPGDGLVESYAVEWRGYISVPTSGNYTFATCSNDGASLYIEGQEDFDYFGQNQQARAWNGTSRYYEAGQKYRILIRYNQNGGDANVSLIYTNETQNYDETGFTGTGQAYDCFPQPQNDPDRLYNLEAHNKLVPATWLSPPGEEYTSKIAACTQEPTYLPAAQVPVSNPNFQKARQLANKLTDSVVSAFDSRLLSIKAVIDAGDMVAAGRLTIELFPEVYDNLVRKFANRMANRDKNPVIPLNDFTATIIALIRDEVDFRKALTGEGKAVADVDVVWGNSAYYTRNALHTEIDNDDHYIRLENESDLSLACSLSRFDRLNYSALPYKARQEVPVPGNAVIANPDPAGVLTSRQWFKEHVVAGTKRRPIEKAIEEFMCTEIDEWRNVEHPEDWIGRDVDRFPGGNYDTFLNECKTCHAGLDAMRGAYALWDWSNDRMKYSPEYPARRHDQDQQNDNIWKAPANEGAYDPLNPQNYNGPYLDVTKWLNHNIQPPSLGHRTTDNSWQIYLTDSTNQSRFQWNPTYLSGNGIREFGRAIANSGMFPRCMVKKMFREICDDDPFAVDFPADMDAWLNQVAVEFSQDYNMKEVMAALPWACIQ